MNLLYYILTLSGLIYVVMSLKQVQIDESLNVRRNVGFGLTSRSQVAFYWWEAGYLPKPFKPGLRFVPWLLFSSVAQKRVVVPARTVALVIAGGGRDLKHGRKTASFKDGDIAEVLDNPREFEKRGGKRGAQRQVLRAGWSGFVHGGYFVVITTEAVFGFWPDGSTLSVEEALAQYGLTKESLKVKSIPEGMCGSIVILDGPPPPAGAIGTRPKALRNDGGPDLTPEKAIAANLVSHNSFQDMDHFFEEEKDGGLEGYAGLQDSAVPAGEYSWNPLLVQCTIYSLADIKPGWAACIKAKVCTLKTPGETSGNQPAEIGDIGLWKSAVGPGILLVALKEPLKYPGAGANPEEVGPGLYEGSAYDIILVSTRIRTVEGTEEVGDKDHSAHIDPDNIPDEFRVDTQDGYPGGWVWGMQYRVLLKDLATFLLATDGQDNFEGNLLANLVISFLRAAILNRPAMDLYSLGTRTAIIEEVMANLTPILTDTYHVDVKQFLLHDMFMPKTVTDLLGRKTTAEMTAKALIQEETTEAQRAKTEAATGKADEQRALEATRVRVETALLQAKTEDRRGKGVAAYLERLKGSVGNEGAVALLLAELLVKGEQVLPRVVVSGEGATTLKALVGLLGLNSTQQPQIPTTTEAPTA